MIELMKGCMCDSSCCGVHCLMSPGGLEHVPGQPAGKPKRVDGGCGHCITTSNEVLAAPTRWVYALQLELGGSGHSTMDRQDALRYGAVDVSRPFGVAWVVTLLELR